MDSGSQTNRKKRWPVVGFVALCLAVIALWLATPVVVEWWAAWDSSSSDGETLGHDTTNGGDGSSRRVDRTANKGHGSFGPQ